MKSTFKDFGFDYDSDLLLKSFKNAKKDSSFNELINSLDIDEKELVKRTTLLEECVKEYKNCKNCQSLLACHNKLIGYCYLPMIFNNNIEFNYEACKYKKEFENKTQYMNNIYLFDIPKEIKEAKMADIYLDDKQRVQVIKWLKQFINTYQNNSNKKGLYLNGSFGCGKTYLIAAMFNELAKKNIKSAIIYWPEFLRDLKGSFENGFNDKYDFIKGVELLLIDDIGAENTTAWARDEILGTILQYRMQEHKTTFFTSNLTLEELEQHFSVTRNSMEEVKARRILERINQLTENIKMIGKNLRG